MGKSKILDGFGDALSVFLPKEVNERYEQRQRDAKLNGLDVEKAGQGVARGLDDRSRDREGRGL